MALEIELPEFYVTYTNKPYTLEVLDYIPVVSLVSGVARALFGMGQSFVGVAALPFQIASRISGNENTFILAKGISNIVRGAIAGSRVPFAGNVTLFMYDHMPTFKKEVQFALGIHK